LGYEFVEILLPDGKRVTVDSSFGQLYYKLVGVEIIP
jgi:hypothetical protein